MVYKTLSTRSASVMLHFNNKDQPCFTFAEVATLLKKVSSNDAVKKLMRDMVKRGLLLRIRPGLYWVIPYEEDPETYFPNRHLVAKYLVEDAAYYIGYYSALDIDSLITQPSLTEQIVVDKQIKPSIQKIKGIKFQFIYYNRQHFFGIKSAWVDSHTKTNTSELEKTFVDCLYKPDYGGGITEIAKALYKAKDRINFPLLLEYCIKFKAQNVIKRLGYLLELLNISTPIIEQLQKLRTESYTVLEPSYEKKGKLISRWSIQQNMETEDITASLFS